MRVLLRGWWALLFLVAAVTLDAAPAAACGGTFCDGSGPVPMPVDQTGENILFVQDGPAVEAHIQIQYTGEPQRFAWVVPIPSLPQFRVGSDLFFRELLRSSVPSYSLVPSFSAPSCAEDNAVWLALSPLMLGAAVAAVPLAAGFMVAAITLGVLFTITGGCSGAGENLEGSGSSGSGGAGATVVFRDSVGAFDITVLQAGTADEVLTWLGDNQYSVPLSTRPLLAQYANENHLFAAIKLVSTAQTDEIHPIVLRYETGVPCIPLRLTAVAAAMDMGVRAFFLGQARTVSSTYRTVELNPLQLDWLNLGSNYKDLVSRAVDDPESGGVGFVTEYAGTSSVVQRGNFLWWSELSPSVVATPAGALAALEQRGLASCTSAVNAVTGARGVTVPNSCTFFHPLVRGLLQDHLPPPAGSTEREYWSQPTLDAPTYNAEAFLADFRERVDAPARNAEALTAGHPYLTRLFTTISPDEMTVDPEFHERPDLPDVNNTNQVATSTVQCDGYTSVALPDGRVVEVPPNGTWPAFGADMPWASRVEDMPDLTTRTVLADRQGQINRSLSAWNGQRRPRPSALAECACAGTTPGVPVWGAAVLLAVWVGRRRGART